MTYRRLVPVPAALAYIVFVCAAAYGQTSTLSGIVIGTNVPGARFQVDGQTYTATASFLWPKGSKHVVLIPPTAVNPNPPTQIATGACVELSLNQNPATQYDAFCRSRYTFGGWTDSTGLLGTSSSPTQIITADPSVTSLMATFTVEFKINLVFFDGAAQGTLLQPDSTCTPSTGPRPAGSGPGVVFVDGACYRTSGSIWMSAGTHSLNAYPYEGFVFKSFTYDVGPSTPFLSNFTAVGPGTVAPRFEPAKRLRISTSPAGLQASVDGQTVATFDASRYITTYPIPGNFDFAEGSTHTLGAPTPQYDSTTGKDWVFDSWSNGGGQDMKYITRDTNVPDSLIANFVPGARASFVTVPNGLKLKVDGRDWQSYNFVWGVGKSHTVAAPAEQVNSRGRKYSFKSWSNGGDATQTVSADENGLRLTATFEAIPRAVVQSSIPGLTVKVDGADCVTPCNIDRPSGTQIRITVPTMVPNGDLSRYEFTGWPDGVRGDRTITLNQDFQTVSANYRVTNRLMTVVDPDGGAALRIEPASADGFYPTDAQVNITADANVGYRFRRWDGDLSGTVKAGAVSMSSPRIVRALLDKVPAIAPGGVRNAAGGATDSAVAAGSLITIFGGSLANRYEVGPSNPLSQSVGDVAVQVGERYLPIIFVSAEQINAQLPSDLPEGSYTLIVKPAGLAEITAPFTVVRNAPGLFSNVVDSKSYALALHEDGSPITIDSPAKRAETVTLLGTGFGPYDRRVIDGFAIPDNPVVKLVDAAELVAAEVTFQPAFAGAAPGYAGVASTRFKIPKEVPGASSVEMKIRVNGKESNMVLLPIE
jgi:uncharacterized protein (TIGR03437 family)